MSTEQPEQKLPAWYYLVRAIFCGGVGSVLILHEVFDVENPPGPLVIIVGLILMGFAPSDLVTFFRSNGK